MRIAGWIESDSYVIGARYDGENSGVLKKIPLAEAREDRKLLAAIERNGWEKVT